MDILERFNNLVNQIQSTTSRTEKEKILSLYKNDNEVKQILNFIYNPYIVSGISDRKINIFRNILVFDNGKSECQDILGLINYLIKNNTGRHEDLIAIQICIQNNMSYPDLIYGICTQNIKMGIQSATLNKVFGDNFIPTFDVMLANKYYDNPDSYLPDGTEFILTEKLDGVRCVYVATQNGRFYSRQGQAFEGLTQLEDECSFLPLGYVYDGELLLKNDNNLDSKDLYRETMKVVSSDKEKKNVIFNIFDMIPIDDFYKGKSEITAEQRKYMITEIFYYLNTPHLKEVTPLYQGNNKFAIEEHLDRITKAGGEGVMINIANAPYECKRSKNLLKVKKMQTADVKVISLEEGTGQNKNKLGAIVIEFVAPDNNAYTCKVGSGLTQEQREYFWVNPNELLHKIIEISYFEISQNKNGSYGLRFPVFKHIRPDKEEISMY